MLSVVLLSVNLLLFLYILFYGACFLALPFIRPLKRGNDTTRIVTNPPAVTILVPCHNEGPSLLSAIESILEQDYPGTLNVVALLRDELDSSIPFLASKFQFDIDAIRNNQKLVIFRSESREIALKFCGTAPKRDKLNIALPAVTSPYVGFLDADHRADPNWITISIQRLLSSTYAGVQSQRRPLSLRTLPQLWDSAQNHIGNELVNVTFDRTVDNVFFTGTTCVFETVKLRELLFSDCVTEDTFLSYQLLSKGEHITYNSESGSREEVAPDLSSYIARRRRWSCGHNKTFFTLARTILNAPIGWRLKTATLIHGLFYTVPVAVCLLMNVYALHLFVQYTFRIQQSVALISICFSLFISLWMFGRHRSILREVLVLFLWVFPQVTLFFPIPLYYANSDLVFFLILFPYLRYLFWAHLFCLLAPALLIISGGLRTKVLPIHQLLLVMLCYPFIFFFDLWACLLGFSDFLFGRPTWAKISRTHQEDTLDLTNHARSRTIVFRWIVASVCGVFLLLGFNDLTADSNCGEPDSILVNPTIFVPSSSIQWSLHTRSSIQDNNRIAITFTNNIESGDNENVEIIHFIDNSIARTTYGSMSTDHTFEYDAPLGWEPHTYRAVLKSSAVICKRNERFTTTAKELRGSKLFVNGEEFLIKGVIPSFSSEQMGLPIKEGLTQIKNLGANVVRYYHEIRDNTLTALDDLKLLAIDQPDFSTWSDMNLMFSLSRSGLERRFDRLMNDGKANPYTLFHTVGNELEILDPAARVPKLIEFLKDLTIRYPNDWFAYSTYFVYLRLPTAVYGVNMLDTGSTYWHDGLKVIQSLEKPFYASEFGGFVAAYEDTPSELRAYRLGAYWNMLLKAGALGTVVHQSHDNWSQPVISGFNDPLSPDQPDDLRGIWDTKNIQKPLIARTIEGLFSDLEANVAVETVAPDISSIPLRVKNKRPYWLHNITFDGVVGSFDLAPGAEHEVTVPNPRTPELRLVAHFSTHHGLTGIAVINIRLPIRSSITSILNADILDLVTSDSTVTGRLLNGNEITAVFPDNWKTVMLNGEAFPLKYGRNSFPLNTSVEEVINLESSQDATAWHPIDTAHIGRGPIRLRFKLRRSYPSGTQLLLAGIGTTKYWIRYSSQGKWQESTAHPYRENIIDLDSLRGGVDDYYYLLLTRADTTFLSAALNPSGSDVEIKFEMPQLFSPVPFKFERIN